MSNETKWIWSEKNPGDNPPIGGGNDDPTRRVADDPPASTIAGFDDDVTTHAAAGTGEDQDIGEPVTGWLVVVRGPGLGASLTTGSGLSTIGRGRDQRLSLPFGDKSMSRSHARLIYDPASRKFFIAPGDGKNLTRVNGELLLGNLELEGGELIELGDTHLRFVPFCGPHFDWADTEGDDGGA